MSAITHTAIRICAGAHCSHEVHFDYDTSAQFVLERGDFLLIEGFNLKLHYSHRERTLAADGSIFDTFVYDLSGDTGEVTEVIEHLSTLFKAEN